MSQDSKNVVQDAQHNSESQMGDSELRHFLSELDSDLSAWTRVIALATQGDPSQVGEAEAHKAQGVVREMRECESWLLDVRLLHRLKSLQSATLEAQLQRPEYLQ